jgi:hypothetical protein
MTDEEQQAIKDFMRTAQAALNKLKQTRTTLVVHQAECWICRNRLWRMMFHCHSRSLLTINYLMEGVTAQPYVNALEQLKLQSPEIYKQAERLAQQDAADLNWLEKLAKLEDKRS